MENRFAAARGLLAAACLLPPVAVDAAGPDTVARLLEAGRHQEVLAASETYLANHPDDDRVRFQRAVALVRLGRDQEAAALFEALAEAHPDWPAPRNNLAVLHARAGDYQAAQRWLETALRTQPAYATAHANLNDIYAARAAAAYRRALDRDAGDHVGTELILLSGLPAPAAAPADTPELGETEALADSARAAVLALVERWRKAWAEQDVAAYLAAYAADFRPEDGRAVEAWRAERRERVGAPDWIEVEIASIEVSAVGDGRARVRFEQAYRSDGYADRARKTLTLVRRQDGWRILRETGEPL